MIARRQIVVGLGLLLCAVSGSAHSQTNLGADTRLIMVRHGDRSGSDEMLNATGRARADALVVALEGVPLDAIYSPGIKRNLDTAAPLAAARGISVSRISDGQAARLLPQRIAGQSAIWIGNKGNLAAIWKALGAPGAAPLEYGDLWIVTVSSVGTLRVERRHFGP
ncbi:histidine phosphatase family protein [Puniceibacterium sp. IMCC21224]|uniref:histidine phosphatase family protein n=1 Tax=Puniceibacterium sp. IMCC21224 TaxID=1618204 RepID=UPI00064DEC88|nr:histidine phosphatase family protein [Puniceibacterium sp. IMCC21224]KMK66772.1 phosphoglycerate mutase family protein [Puniceibacterium sp. IMCC21224]